MHHQKFTLVEWQSLQSLNHGDDRTSQSYRIKSHRCTSRIFFIIVLFICFSQWTVAQSCIPLSGSKMCSAFPDASISSTDSSIVNLFPFLQSVTNTATFDEQLRIYVSTTFIQMKYQQLLGCRGIDLTKAKDIYARFTTTVICNAVIQNSRNVCGLSPAAARPVCAETCAQQAESESVITANRDLCPQLSPNADDQIRADFTNCALPANSLTSACISGATNEPNNCGFGESTVGLCQYCASGGINSTDTCCYNSDVKNRCVNIALPTITGFVTFTASLPTQTGAPPKSNGTTGESYSKLSSGAIAGIIVGSVLGLSLIAGLFFLFISCLRKRRESVDNGDFKKPSVSRFQYLPNNTRNGQSAMTVTPVASKSDGYEILPGGRIARMSALEDQSNPMFKVAADQDTSITGVSRRRNILNSSSDESVRSINHTKVLRPPPTGRRAGSLSSNSALAADYPQSPNSGSIGGHSSHLAPTSLQSEQLLSFKDYYSVDEIHPGEKVAVLWAYQPRATDEFALERGDMLKVAGIWDDGWATGVMINEHADEWDSKHNTQRDSGVSETIHSRHESPPNTSNEIKAFPLVCVCLPEHWRRTVEGDASIDTGLNITRNANLS
ncbi:putative sh3 domain-containing protein [Erysiphe neolycopersici]|uniref:Putative sh3 domain-containing protein n=1 Tax=Erysiphe neolycopersici TaxID=212602 RepID=A0A420HWS1_9PEZI|nr:putative sh3 domain-containing protein [Erysiphe neolycopersici]